MPEEECRRPPEWLLECAWRASLFFAVAIVQRDNPECYWTTEPLEFDASLEGEGKTYECHCVKDCELTVTVDDPSEAEKIAEGLSQQCFGNPLRRPTCTCREIKEKD